MQDGVKRPAKRESSSTSSTSSKTSEEPPFKKPKEEKVPEGEKEDDVDEKIEAKESPDTQKTAVSVPEPHRCVNSCLTVIHLPVVGDDEHLRSFPNQLGKNIGGGLIPNTLEASCRNEMKPGKLHFALILFLFLFFIFLSYTSDHSVSFTALQTNV